jgi:hypothetical protein
MPPLRRQGSLRTIHLQAFPKPGMVRSFLAPFRGHQLEGFAYFLFYYKRLSNRLNCGKKAYLDSASLRFTSKGTSLTVNAGTRSGSRDLLIGIILREPTVLAARNLHSNNAGSGPATRGNDLRFSDAETFSRQPAKLLRHEALMCPKGCRDS